MPLALILFIHAEWSTYVTFYVEHHLALHDLMTSGLLILNWGMEGFMNTGRDLCYLPPREFSTAHISEFAYILPGGSKCSSSHFYEEWKNKLSFLVFATIHPFLLIWRTWQEQNSSVLTIVLWIKWVMCQKSIPVFLFPSIPNSIGIYFHNLSSLLDIR